MNKPESVKETAPIFMLRPPVALNAAKKAKEEPWNTGTSNLVHTLKISVSKPTVTRVTAVFKR